MDRIYIFWVYILASQPRGTLYNILDRVAVHRAGAGSGFTRKYGVKQLVYFEDYGDIRAAIQREKSMKRYLRQWKINLIEERNPHWIDLYPGLLSRHGGGIGG